MRCNEISRSFGEDGPAGTLPVVDRELADADVVEFLDRARADDAAQARSRRRWLRHQAEEGATLVGTLVDLAERAATVVLATTGGRRWTGRLVDVVDDALVLEAPGARVLVATWALASVRVPDGGAPADGARAPATRTSLLDLLAVATEERREIVVHPGAGEAVRGRLLAVGVDVLTVRSAAGGTTYVAATSVSEAAVLASG